MVSLCPTLPSFRSSSTLPLILSFMSTFMFHIHTWSYVSIQDPGSTNDRMLINFFLVQLKMIISSFWLQILTNYLTLFFSMAEIYIYIYFIKIYNGIYMTFSSLVCWMTLGCTHTLVLLVSLFKWNEFYLLTHAAYFNALKYLYQ